MAQIPRQHDRPASTPKRAFSYLRVSSAGQVNTDYDPEGISLPAQRAAIQRRAAELDAEIVAEFVEPGRSATTVDGRPVLQEMMARLKAEKNVDYVLVYARSRLHRNSIDAAITKRDLRNAGATLISVMDYTEDSAIGDLVATVLDGVNEYQSRASGADIAYKVGQKIVRGGSVGRAPIGYLNVRETFEGREVRTIAVDPVRGPLVRMAFELYATGTYGFHALIATLSDAGLRTKPTKRFPAGTPISLNSLGNLLRDRYYLGYVSYRGVEYKGRHEPLVEPEVFDRVQHMLETRRAGGVRERTHNHYLKGVVWCHRCQRRLMIMRGKSHTGDLHFYYFCRGRQQHACDLPYLPVARVETAVVDNYATIMLPADLRDDLSSRIGEVLSESAGTSAELRSRIKDQLKTLDRQEDRFLDLVGDPDWPQDKIGARLRRIRDERDRLARQLDDSDTPRLDTAGETMLYLLDLLADPQELYRRCKQQGRRVLNQAFFAKVYFDHDEDGPFVAADELSDLVLPLVKEARNDSGGAMGAAAAGEPSPALAGSSSPPLVEVPGIEPGSFVVLSGLLRAQLTMSLLGPPTHVSKFGRRAQSLIDLAARSP
ncbi:recombinase [Actinoplanes ianthinogenes]|uniref:Recombinase n=1 Tax=Actinoplanes ianthinogenes TaxID=122358 RepID=A0ABN6CIV5_9ACTN|nr:recombinase [Actinoplanes ianthinogenes]GGQ99004.1 recombinase [Actinoplanes ianthinogenes]